MKKTVVIGTITTAALAAMLTGGVAASAADCTPSAGTPAKPGPWVASDLTTTWTTNPTPVDPDGQDGEDNLLNTQRPGQLLTREVADGPPSEVVVTPAYIQRYSWTGGPHQSDEPPAFPSSDWQPNVKGDPHKIGQPGAYFRSHGNKGNGDWFYLEYVAAATEQVPAVPHTEYQWAIETRSIIDGTAPETCEAPGDGGEVQPPGDAEELPPADGEAQPPAEEPSTPDTPQTTTSQTTPAVSTPVAHTTQVKGQQAVSVNHRSSAAVAVPTSIDAGL